MIFLQSAGMSAWQAKKFAEEVRCVVGSGDWDRLLLRLQKLGFSASHSSYVAVAIAATREVSPPSSEWIRPAPEIRDEFIDVATVVFLFNIVNRIADAYGLQPEWARFRRGEWLRRWTRWLMSTGVRYQMPLANDHVCDKQSVTDHVVQCLRLLDVGTKISPTWSLFQHVPTIEFAIGQLLCSCIQYSCLDDRSSQAIAETVRDRRTNPPEELIAVVQSIFRGNMPSQSAYASRKMLEGLDLGAGASLDIFETLFSEPRSYIAFRAMGARNATLMRGFTTVRDAGGVDYGFARAANEDLFPSPRLFHSGRIISQTSGHGDFRRRRDPHPSQGAVSTIC